MQRSKLSRRVAELEARLGLRLLQRNTRRVSLTPMGEQIYVHALAMAREAQRLRPGGRHGRHAQRPAAHDGALGAGGDAAGRTGGSLLPAASRRAGAAGHPRPGHRPGRRRLRPGLPRPGRLAHRLAAGGARTGAGAADPGRSPAMARAARAIARPERVAAAGPCDPGQPAELALSSARRARPNRSNSVPAASAATWRRCAKWRAPDWGWRCCRTTCAPAPWPKATWRNCCPPGAPRRHASTPSCRAAARPLALRRFLDFAAAEMPALLA
ncbi:LysR family transcriptional regulator [Achromobacter xylosoxidans]|nr:LysR family transcriptional regulator [Achromobacter xylosoxidans]